MMKMDFWRRCAIEIVIFGSVFIGYGLTIELRCYCNLPDCVHTAYMCKSEIGCFQELPYGPNSGKRSPRIGCLELWSPKRPFHCVGLKTVDEPPFTTTTTTTATTGRPTRKLNRKKMSLLRCCMENMCNYVPQLEPELNISVLKAAEEVTISIEKGSNSGRRKSPVGDSGTEKANISESLWFRVAVIAVPILGGIILLVLIMMACTLLRSDWRKVTDHDRLLPPMGVVDGDAIVQPVLVTSSATGGGNGVGIPPPKSCQKFLYSKPFPSYLRGQLRHYHSDTTLVVSSEKAKDGSSRPSTVLLPNV